MRKITSLTLALAAVVAGLVMTGSFAEDGKKAKCIVAGKEIAVTADTKYVVVNGEKQYFCCANCPKAFAGDPEKFVKEAGKCPVNKGGDAKIDKKERAVVNNGLYYFCCAGCPDAFKSDPAKFVKKLVDPVTGKEFAPAANSPRVVKNGQVYLFANAETKAEFDKAGDKFVVAYK